MQWCWKTPVENAPRTNVEKHLSLSSDIPPATRFPPHQSRRGRLPSSTRQILRALFMQSSAPAPGAPSQWDSAMGALEDSISQCTFLQMTYTAENPQADGSATPGARPRFRPPRRRDPHATSPAPTTTGWREDRCPVVSKRPLHSRAAANMSPHIRICPEPVLTDHAPFMCSGRNKIGARAPYIP
jgi:hypothetical protein